ncbi:MAG: hypothetical protein KZQ58_03250, partial [gamma proteobacterium symbiont of Bathyaustriella thionipta]|nr:hypothetical protein [gamma proteobacterium symbiont of Bathyaustriella thionipta]
MNIYSTYLGVILIWSTTPLAIQWSNGNSGFLFSVRQKTRYFRGAMTPPAVEFSQLPAFLA